ncbi:hypothetical protein [Streptomyces xanthochromogenes]|uniref:hypothetical protein n=1 Tax=Streptomyces xanthochromogenes TaxID=67384 RepID=UPI00343D27E3
MPPAVIPPEGLQDGCRRIVPSLVLNADGQLQQHVQGELMPLRGHQLCYQVL